MNVTQTTMRLLTKEGVYVLADDDWSAIDPLDQSPLRMADHVTVAFCNDQGDPTGACLQYKRIGRATEYGTAQLLPSLESAALWHANRVRCNVEGFTGGVFKYRVFLKGSQFTNAVNGSTIHSLPAKF